MKKIVALLLSSFLILGILAGCTPTETPKDESSAAESKAEESSAAASTEINAGVFYYNFSDVYISSVRTSMDEALTALNAKFQNYDANTNQTTQSEQINTAITDGANLLIVNIVETSSPDAAQAAVEIARTADIPIIFFNREVDSAVVNSYEKCAFVGTDAAEAGHMQGDMIGDYLLENFDAVDLNKDGKISYVMFKGQEANAEAEFRTQYAVEDADKKLKDAGKDALEFYDKNNTSKYLVDPNGAWSAQAATDYMNTILSEYNEDSKNMVEMVIANNDNMAEGAISALQTIGFNKGKDEEGSTTIPVFGVDAVLSAQQLINEGKMTGTIQQDAEGMAKTINTLVENVANGSDLMANTESYNVDTDVAKIRVPYGVFTGEAAA